MVHSFDVDIATEYGVNCAVLLQNIYFWTEKNKANDHNFHDGSYWTYNSTKAFAKLFPYMSEKQISYALNKLEQSGIIKTGNYNPDRRDKTKWYALTKQGYCILQNGIMQSDNLSNLYIYNNIYNKEETDNKQTDIKEIYKERFSEHEEASLSPNADKNISSDSFYRRVLDKKSAFIDGIDISYAFRSIWNEYPKKSGKKAACNAYLKFVRSNTREKIVELIINLDTYKKVCADRGTEEQYIKMMQGFINDKQFDEYSKYNCDVYNEKSKKYYETKEEYVEAIKNGEIEMYLLPRYMITF